MKTSVALLAVAGLVALIGSSGEDSAAQGEVRPNVIIVETDDQTLESLRVMTNVQRLLAAEGTTFDNHFASFSLCCPSRATRITGQYAHNNGVFGNQPPDGGYEKLDHANTLPVWLQRAGYYTAHIGKYLNGYGRRDPREVPPGWSEWHGSIDPTTYRFYDYTLNENGNVVTYGSRPQDYQADVYAEKALDLLRRRAPQAQPFFLWLAFLAPHSGGPRESDDPRNQATPAPAPRHRDRFASEPLPQPPSFNEADVSDKPDGIRSRPLLPPARVAAVTENYRQRLESLLAVDEAVARLVAELERLGELQRTVIVFTTDNGFFHGEHRIPSGKVLLYEPSIRVPLIIRGPGFARGLRVGEHVINVDVPATIVEISGATPTVRLDGRSLRPLARAGAPAWGRDVVIEHGPARSPLAAIRTPRYVYGEYANGTRELYDLARDPHQLESRHADPAYARVREELARRLAQLRRCAGDACRRGPRLAFRVACGRGVTASIGGADAGSIARIDAFIGGVRRAVDTRAPFRVAVARRHVAGRTAPVRLRVVLQDGRAVTHDRVLRCR